MPQFHFFVQNFHHTTQKKNETNLKITSFFTTKVGTFAVTDYPCLYELSGIKLYLQHLQRETTK